MAEPTLTFLINGEARLLLSEIFSTLDILIRASPFIDFKKIFLPPRLLMSPCLSIFETGSIFSSYTYSDFEISTLFLPRIKS